MNDSSKQIFNRTHLLGYTFTSNTEQCRQNLLQLVGGPKISAATVARIIGVMVRTHTGLDDPATLQNLNATGTSIWDKEKSNEPKTWNMEVFIKGELYESFDHKRSLVKYQPQSEVIKVLIHFHTLKYPLNFENSNF